MHYAVARAVLTKEKYSFVRGRVKRVIIRRAAILFTP